jgi:phosphoribosylanthranilate isomerase
MRTRVKICGITNPENARMALAAGADYLGLVLTASPRQVSLDQGRRVREALPPGAPLVGVFAEEPPAVVAPRQMELGLPVIQVGGWLEAQSELPCEVWHVLRAATLPDPSALPMVPLRTYLLEAYDPARAGGTGKTADWGWARGAVGAGLRLIVAGGLTPENVGELVEKVRPHGVDVSSGVERSPGQKDPDLVRAFIERVRAADRARPRRS